MSDELWLLTCVHSLGSIPTSITNCMFFWTAMCCMLSTAPDSSVSWIFSCHQRMYWVFLFFITMALLTCNLQITSSQPGRFIYQASCTTFSFRPTRSFRGYHTLHIQLDASPSNMHETYPQRQGHRWRQWPLRLWRKESIRKPGVWIFLVGSTNISATLLRKRLDAR